MFHTAVKHLVNFYTAFIYDTGFPTFYEPSPIFLTEPTCPRASGISFKVTLLINPPVQNGKRMAHLQQARLSAETGLNGGVPIKGFDISDIGIKFDKIPTKKNITDTIPILERKTNGISPRNEATGLFRACLSALEISDIDVGIEFDTIPIRIDFDTIPIINEFDTIPRIFDSKNIRF